MKTTRLTTIELVGSQHQRASSNVGRGSWPVRPVFQPVLDGPGDPSYKTSPPRRVMSLCSLIRKSFVRQSRTHCRRLITRERDGYVARAGVTLTEVLMSLMIMSIGVVSVATLFPISALRTLEASKQTSSTIARFTSESWIDTLPELIHNPDDGISKALSPYSTEPFASKYDGRAFRNHNYVVDPYGYLAGDPSVQTFFGNLSGAAPPASFNPMTRYSGGFIDPVVATTFVTQPDNWKVVVESQADGGTPTGVTSVNLASDADLSSINLSNPDVVYRAVIFNVDGDRSQVRTPLTGITLSPPTVTWATALPTLFNNGNIGKVRIESSEEFYTWMWSVRKHSNGPASVDAVIFFRRGFNPEYEQIYDASFRKISLGSNGVPGADGTNGTNADDDFLGVANDVGEIGYPNTDDGPNNIVTIRWPDGMKEPVIKRGGYIFDTANGFWYRIRASQNETYTAGAPGYTTVQLVLDEAIKANNNDQDWNGNAVQDTASPPLPPTALPEAPIVYRGGAILHPNVANVFPLESKEP